MKLRLKMFIHSSIMLLIVGLIGNTVNAYPILVNVTYIDPVILKPTPAPPIPIPYPNIPSEIKAQFQFDSSELPALGENSEVSNMTSASMVFGDANLTVADLFKTDDDVSVLPNFRIGLDSAGEINLLQYAFFP